MTTQPRKRASTKKFAALPGGVGSAVYSNKENRIFTTSVRSKIGQLLSYEKDGQTLPLVVIGTQTDLDVEKLENVTPQKTKSGDERFEFDIVRKIYKGLVFKHKIADIRELDDLVHVIQAIEEDEAEKWVGKETGSIIFHPLKVAEIQTRSGGQEWTKYQRAPPTFFKVTMLEAEVKYSDRTGETKEFASSVTIEDDFLYTNVLLNNTIKDNFCLAKSGDTEFQFNNVQAILFGTSHLVPPSASFKGTKYVFKVNGVVWI